uniref:Uncharacterized protein n=1 Tax=Anguilla anguilla TaxID=7936 RepID=A0A0E9R4J5_ANGAN
MSQLFPMAPLLTMSD